jgi:hypothetical protein
MESDNDWSISTGSKIKNHCCENFVTTIGIINNYIPSVTFIQEKVNIQHFSFHLPINLLLRSQTTINSNSSNISPPGKLPLSSVGLDDICVFRI